MNITEYIDKIINEVYFCGQLMKNADRSQMSVDDKEGHGNFVTNYDKMIQEELKKRLLSIIPDAAFVGEESDVQPSIDNGYAFIVDPIDGTANFLKDFHHSCISVGITYDGKQVAGVVYQPYADEMFHAVAGGGAFLNGKPIHVSNSDMPDALVLFGTSPYYPELRKKTFEDAQRLCGECVDVRRSGSAALDLCFVASGRADLFFEHLLCPWDYAAGSLILTEAGGVVTRIDGSPITLKEKCPILGTNGITHL